MRYVLIVADLLNGVDHIVGEFLGGVVGGRIKCSLRTIVIDSHTATAVEQFDRHVTLVDLGMGARGFLHGVLDALDVGELRSDVKVKQFQHVHPTSIFESTN